MIKLCLVMVLFLLNACKTEESIISDIDDQEWLVKTDYIRQGCYSGKDCIPSLQHPEKSLVGGNDLEFLDDNNLIVGIWDGEKYVAFPHSILDWHEIVNEDGYSISYCPLTGSALHFETESEFGVSGLLYNSNLIMYDRDSDSHWPQMFLKSAEGSRQGDKLNLKSMIETDWVTWKKLYPNSKVVNSNTGYSRDYESYPYGQYRTCNSQSCGDYIFFPIPMVDERLPAKTRVLSINSENAQKAYPIKNFVIPTLINETIDGTLYAIILSNKEKIGIAFETSSSLSIAEWDIENGSIIIEDENGNQWNILGISTNGSESNLITANAFISYWFSQAAFYPGTEIHS
ncbi:MAG: DUF3179 domain-containing protein [Candidatus Marinimicrobia bacterium]|jgi:hypothetical protein|nr:DUF3179 domain-containing protein [Candidatus Neomarinimicrobiota bacterium]MBT3501365.1 DUF3179 domain-containing protein [Candidatus Neomarinimicrobiota bacterium]MBT3839063.1 DUF3179 domain-containing protein [Candidatus Neomarinimicrobiota bacterium]MBT3998303.1 DUF3179 domain-containing protein [Candidatus Neomarinimicrobiota bacterium]MBT4580387.1 DUF3179 domain-containing protein [Candidatus Neomarinimicrobiota bacterium]